MKLFYATDVHGSDRCFTKFVNAASFYGADAILLGGDLTGKAWCRSSARTASTTASSSARTSPRRARRSVELEKKIANAGYYAFRCDRDEDEALRADPAAREALFLRLMKERLERWVALAEERLRPAADSLHRERRKRRPGRDRRGAPGKRLGAVPRGPGRQAPRRHGGGELRVREPDAVGLPSRRRGGRAHAPAGSGHLPARGPRKAVFNFHCPPYDTGIDSGPKLDENFG